MIVSAEEFIKLRTSKLEEEYHRAAHDSADVFTWNDIIERYPSFKIWVVHNKTVPLAILEILAQDDDPEVRCRVATKRKISGRIFDLLSLDPDETVRHALISNTALTKEQVSSINIEDSEWLRAALTRRVAMGK